MEKSEGLNSEHSRQQVFNMLEQLNIPYVEVVVHGDPVNRKDSPIGELSDTFELAVNTLLGDVALVGSKEASYLLNYFQVLIEMLTSLSNLIMTDTARIARLQKNLQKNIKKVRKLTKDSPITPIPSVFEDAFKEDFQEN